MPDKKLGSESAKMLPELFADILPSNFRLTKIQNVENAGSIVAQIPIYRLEEAIRRAESFFEMLLSGIIEAGSEVGVPLQFTISEIRKIESRLNSLERGEPVDTKQLGKEIRKLGPQEATKLDWPEFWQTYYANSFERRLRKNIRESGTRGSVVRESKLPAAAAASQGVSSALLSKPPLANIAGQHFFGFSQDARAKVSQPATTNAAAQNRSGINIVDKYFVPIAAGNNFSNPSAFNPEITDPESDFEGSTLYRQAGEKGFRILDMSHDQRQILANYLARNFRTLSPIAAANQEAMLLELKVVAKPNQQQPVSSETRLPTLLEEQEASLFGGNFDATSASAWQAREGRGVRVGGREIAFDNDALTSFFQAGAEERRLQEQLMHNALEQLGQDYGAYPAQTFAEMERSRYLDLDAVYSACQGDLSQITPQEKSELFDFLSRIEERDENQRSQYLALAVDLSFLDPSKITREEQEEYYGVLFSIQQRSGKQEEAFQTLAASLEIELLASAAQDSDSRLPPVEDSLSQGSSPSPSPVPSESGRASPEGSDRDATDRS